MSRFSVVVRLGRYFQRAPLWLFRFLEWPFVMLLGNQQNKAPVIIILALPRSGSTVTYQSLCHGLDINYLSNLWHLMYQLPLLGGLFAAKFSRVHRSNFKSEHGFVAGIDGPAEGIKFWQWWLGCGLSDRDCQRHSVAKLRRRSNYLRRVLTTLGALNQQPFATAYLGHALVADRVDVAFPGAVLIRLRRDPISNALSLLQCARQNGVDWFSVKPNQCDGLEDASEHRKVASQVYWLNRRLDQSECAGSMLTVHYEQLCENPMREVERVLGWCEARGISVKLKHALPKSFAVQKVDFGSNIDANKIKVELDILEAKYGVLL
jgi:hypothetical protein